MGAIKAWAHLGRIEAQHLPIHRAEAEGLASIPLPAVVAAAFSAAAFAVEGAVHVVLARPLDQAAVRIALGAQRQPDAVQVRKAEAAQRSVPAVGVREPREGAAALLLRRRRHRDAA